MKTTIYPVFAEVAMRRQAIRRALQVMTSDESYHDTVRRQFSVEGGAL